GDMIVELRRTLCVGTDRLRHRSNAVPDFSEQRHGGTSHGLVGCRRRRATASNDITQIIDVRPETWVTLRTGHMGNTFRLWAGGVDAVVREFGDGGTPALCRPPAGRGGDDGHVPRVRHLP